MRKKSHISLAGCLVRGLELEELRQHRKAFCLGSILPDLNPRMLTVPHEYDGTYGPLKDMVRQTLCDAAARGWESERVFWRRAGVIMHYLADYFTYPHNTSFAGNLRDHCAYENRMKHCMRVLVRMPKGREIFREGRQIAEGIGSCAELFAYISRSHRAYLRERRHTPESDCERILLLCAAALSALLELREAERQSEEDAMCA